MDVLGDLVERDRRSDRLALDVPGEKRRYTYRDFVATAFKAGNLLRHLGVARGDRIAVAPDLLPEPLLTFLGGAKLGAATAFSRSLPDCARAAVVHRDDATSLTAGPGQHLVAYGGPPGRPEVTHWEKVVWGETPAFPPTGVEPDDAALVADDIEYTHGDVLSAAESVVDAAALSADDVVSVRGPLSDPSVVVAGVVAPLLAGATVLYPDADAVGTVAVGGDPVGEERAAPVVEL